MMKGGTITNTAMGNVEWAMVKGERTKRLMKTAVCICLLVITSVSFAQKVSTTISKTKIVLGEQIIVKVKAEGVTRESVQQDFSFPDTVNHIEILADSVEDISNAVIHTLTLTSFDSGYWQLPSFTMLLADQRTLSTEPLNITVLPVDVSNLADYHDIKDILEVKPENNWWIIAAIVLLALISLFAVLWFMNAKTTAPSQNIFSTKDLQQLYDSIMGRLTTFESGDLTGKHAVMSFFAETSASVKKFTDAAYQQRSAHLTTGEYMLEMKEKLPDAGGESSYFQFLRLADAVKFAKYLPPAEDIKAAIPVLKHIITTIYYQAKPVS